MLLVEVFHDMVIENAPFLERLYVLDKLGPARIRVIHTIKLTVLGYSCAEFNELVTGSLSVQVQQPSSSPSYIYYRTTVSASSATPSWFWSIDDKPR